MPSARPSPWCAVCAITCYVLLTLVLFTLPSKQKRFSSFLNIPGLVSPDTYAKTLSPKQPGSPSSTNPKASTARTSWSVESCKDAGHISGQAEVAVVVVAAFELDQSTLCSLFTWKAVFDRFSMVADFVVFVDVKFGLGLARERLLQEHGFIVVKAAIPGVFRREIYVEKGKAAIRVTQELYSFYLKLYAAGLTQYRAVICMDLDAHPTRNLLDTKALSWLKENQKQAEPSWEIMHVSNGDALVAGGFFFVKPNTSRCESMLARVKAKDPWSPMFGWQHPEHGPGSKYSAFPKWKEADCSMSYFCSHPRVTSLGDFAESMCRKEDAILSGCAGDVTDQGLLAYEYILSSPRLYDTKVAHSEDESGELGLSVFHGFKPTEEFQAIPEVELQRRFRRYVFAGSSCKCSSYSKWFAILEWAVNQRKLPSMCMPMYHSIVAAINRTLAGRDLATFRSACGT